jgi:hypothetical protein
MSEPVHRTALIKALVLCWTRIECDSKTANHQNTAFQSLEQELRVACALLCQAVDGKVDMLQEMEPLFLVSPELKMLFPQTVSVEGS